MGGRVYRGRGMFPISRGSGTNCRVASPTRTARAIATDLWGSYRALRAPEQEPQPVSSLARFQHPRPQHHDDDLRAHVATSPAADRKSAGAVAFDPGGRKASHAVSPRASL